MHYSPKTDFEHATPIPATTLRKTRLFGLDVVNDTTPTAIAALLAPGRRRRRVAFLNAHCVNVAASDPDYTRALHSADAVLPDGAGIELALRLSGTKMVENLNGTDFTPKLLREAARRGLSVFLLGGRPGIADAAAARLVHQTPGLRIAGTRDGFSGAANTAEAIAHINDTGADILLVALGVPAQDVWLERHASQLRPVLSLGVGALFDFLAGAVPRAPKPIRRARLEWAWRLAQEPKRLAKRYLIGNPVFVARALVEAGRGVTVKRAMDVSLAGTALLLATPLLLLIAAAIKLDSKGAVFFRQTRVGQNGAPFMMLKFRSMQTDAESLRQSLLSQSDRNGLCFKARRDPRITRMGRLLRRTSLDEVPQLINVLRGEMSLVGPRPALPQEVAAYPARALGRLQVKPGITGIWQVSGRADIGFDKMIDMDLAYLRSMTPWLDILLLCMTFRAVVGGRGAY